MNDVLNHLQRDRPKVVNPRTFELVFPGRPTTINEFIRLHRMKAHGITRDYRDQATWLARQAGMHRAKVSFIELVEVCPEYRTNRSLPDTGAAVLVVKAIVDGLVDAGVVPNDTPAYVGSQLHRPPALSTVGADQLVVRFHTVTG